MTSSQALLSGIEDSRRGDRWEGGDGPPPDDAEASGPIDCLSPDDRAASLLRTIESEIIPRLMLAHAQPSNDAQAHPEPAAGAGPEEVAELTALVLGTDARAGAEYVRAQLRQGVPLERMYLDLLVGTAQRLGAMWEADLCDFTQVTIGLWRLQQVVHEHSSSFRRENAASVPSHRAMLVTAPGSQHTFGVVMVSEFFRRAGWDVWGGPGSTLEEMTSTLGGSWFDLLGLSVGAECHVPSLASAILTLRKASLNPSVVVMVGGPVVSTLENFVALVGADATAGDAVAAVAQAERLVALRAVPT